MKAITIIFTLLTLSFGINAKNSKSIEITRISDCSIAVRPDWPIKQIDEIKYSVQNNRYIVAPKKYCWEGESGFFLFLAETIDSKYKIFSYDTHRFSEIYAMKVLPEILTANSQHIWLKLSSDASFLLILLDSSQRAITGIFKHSNSILTGYNFSGEFGLIFVTEYAKGVNLNIREGGGLISEYEVARYVYAIQPGRETKLQEKRRSF